MKLLVAAIFKICTQQGLYDDERILSCFDHYVNCSITMKTATEAAALKQLEKCKGI